MTPSAREPRGRERERRAILFGSPPTPNGDLHLGHVAGPYLGADVLTRYLRLQGVDAHYATWSDEYQNYVVARSKQLGESPAATAERFNREIRKSLEGLGLGVEHYMRPPFSERHAKGVTEFCRRLYDAGELIVAERPCPYSEELGRFLLESDLGGLCPHCRRPAGGGMCEECGHPNSGVDLIDPVCHRTGETPEARPLKRLFFPLGRHRDAIRESLDGAVMSPRLRAMAESMLEKGLPDVPVSQPGDWGVPVPVPELSGQVLNSWFEMCPSYLITARETAELLGWDPPDDTGPLDWPDTELYQFFGSDNGFFHAVFYPALYRAYQPDGHRPRHFLMNEFYRLDGSKFSTSRNHAVWPRDLLETVPADMVRFYVCWNRPETEQSNFRLEELRATLDRELVEGWQGWLDELQGRLDEAFGGAAPEADRRTPEQQAFESRVEELIRDTERAYDARGFSLQQAARNLSELVRRARAFGQYGYHWRQVESRRGELQTSLALELATARALALLASPILPTFARRLWADLGLAGSPEENGWEEKLGPVPASTRVELSKDYFEAVELSSRLLDAS